MKPSLVRVLEARYLGGHRVWLRFDDGFEGEVDLAPESLHERVRRARRGLS